MIIIILRITMHCFPNIILYPPAMPITLYCKMFATTIISPAYGKALHVVTHTSCCSMGIYVMTPSTINLSVTLTE